MKVEEIITERIVKLLEAGTVPWHKPWANRGADALPRNAVTKRQYRGINVFILASKSYGSPYWLTYREAVQLGGHVRKDEHGTPIIFWKWLSREVEKGRWHHRGAAFPDAALLHRVECRADRKMPITG
jgi:antirestriction protein ArdC